MKRALSVLLLVVVLMALTAVPVAQAQEEPPLLEQLPNGDCGLAADAFVGDTSAASNKSAAADFRVLVGEKLTIYAIQIWGAYYHNQPYTDDFTVIFHEAATDTPWLPGPPMRTEHPVASTRETTGMTFAGGKTEYLYTLPLNEPLVLTAGLYWIEIYNNGNTDTNTVGNTNYFFWEGGNPDTSGTSGRTDALYAAYAHQAPGTAWGIAPPLDLALRLLGTSERFFTWTPEPPLQGQEVTFSIPAGATQTEIFWSVACDPGQTSWECSQPLGTGDSATRTFEQPGAWLVKLNMCDISQICTTQQQVVTVANAAPAIKGMGLFLDEEPLTPNPSFVGQAVVARASVQYGEESATCTVDYGDGSSVQAGDWFYWDPSNQSCTGPAHTYTESGTYVVTVVVTDPDHKTGFLSIDHVVEGGTPQVGMVVVCDSPPTTPVEPSFVGQPVMAGAMVEFADEAATCTVDYGAGAGPEPGTMYPTSCRGLAHTYMTPGEYTVEIKVTNANGKAGWASTIHGVIPGVGLTAISPASAQAGSDAVQINLIGSGFSDASVVRWNNTTDLATTFVNADTLTAVIPVYLLASVQTAQISIYDSDSGGTSPVLAFFVTEATAGVTGQDVASGTDPSATRGPTTATATGDGLLVVAQYDANPGGTPSFTDSGDYFDVYAAPGNTFSQVEIVACGLGASEELFWWDADANTWIKADPQSYDATSGCVTLIVTVASSPSLSQLQDTVFVSGIEAEGNTAPVADPGGPYLGAINTAITFDGSASFDHDDDPLTYTWDFGDGSSSTSATPSHAYSATGIYDVCVTVNDGTLASAAACTLAVVYNPSEGFVTGGGWILSPAGAYKPDESLSGKAAFGFVSKYKKGATIPEGNTEFQFQAGGFTFHSSAYDWLVVSKDKVTAQFKGSGLVNGTPAPNGSDYKFMLWAGDGTGPNGLDTVRIRIWWEDAYAVEQVVYDNGFDQEIDGGSIVVHTASTKSAGVADDAPQDSVLYLPMVNAD